MKTPRKQHPRRSRISSRLSAALRHRLAEHSAARGVYECDVLEAAVDQYLSGTSDMTLIYRRLDGLNRTMHLLERTLDRNGELLKELVLVYLKNTPRLPAFDQQAAAREAARRYQTIIERVAASLSAGKSWVDDLPRETLSPLDPSATDADGAGKGSGPGHGQ